MSNLLPIYNSPSLTPTHKMNDQSDKVLQDHAVIEVVNPPKRNQEDESKDIETPKTKKQRLSTPEGTLDSSPFPIEEVNDTSPTKTLTKKQIEKLGRQKQREMERIEKEKKREEDRIRKEEERRVKEDERKRKAYKKEMEKEMRRKKLEEEKLEREKKKDEERLKKLTEKGERERQRLEKKRKNEELKERKDHERKLAEEEKRKAEESKERSQMKISNFFTIGKTVKSSPIKNEPKKDTQIVDLSNDESKEKEEETDIYNKVFLPFFQKKNVIMALSIQLTDSGLKKSIADFDSIVKAANNKSENTDISKFFKACKPKLREKNFTTPQDIVNALNSSQATESQIYEMFQNLLPMKYLQFYENIKPPYIGTWCSSNHMSTKLPVRNPFDTSKSGLDYSYDSDAEWNGEDAEDEGEGEDIDNDDEDDDDDDIDDEEEMDDFVESNDLMKKKKRIMGPLVAISKWNNDDENDHEFFDEIKYERLDINIEFSIDPFTNYWDVNKEKVVNSQTTEHTSFVNLLKNQGTSPNKSTSRSPNILTAQKPTIKDPKAIHELIQFIEKNNDFTIGTLVELSKKEFKTFTKALLKHTIQDIAFYNKKSGNWIVKPELKEKLSIGSEK